MSSDTGHLRLGESVQELESEEEDEAPSGDLTTFSAAELQAARISARRGRIEEEEESQRTEEEEFNRSFADSNVVPIFDIADRSITAQQVILVPEQVNPSTNQSQEPANQEIGRAHV